MRSKKLFHLAFILVFLVITLFINFFHTEKSGSSHNNCPACRFLNSSLTTGQINFFTLPPLVFSATLKTFDSVDYEQIFFIEPTPRSPPQT